MENNNLVIGAQVLEQMSKIAALEVEGVAGLSERAVDIKSVAVSGKLLKSTKVNDKDGAVAIDVYIKVKSNFNAKEVAENVQTNVKEKLQSMTGTAITRVNVIIADVEFVEEK